MGAARAARGCWKSDKNERSLRFCLVGEGQPLLERTEEVLCVSRVAEVVIELHVQVVKVMAGFLKTCVREKM